MIGVVIFGAPVRAKRQRALARTFSYLRFGIRQASEPGRIWSRTLGFIQSRLMPRLSYHRYCTVARAIIARRPREDRINLDVAAASRNVRRDQISPANAGEANPPPFRQISDLRNRVLSLPEETVGVSSLIRILFNEYHNLTSALC